MEERDFYARPAEVEADLQFIRDMTRDTVWKDTLEVLQRSLPGVAALYAVRIREVYPEIEEVERATERAFQEGTQPPSWEHLPDPVVMQLWVAGTAEGLTHIKARWLAQAYLHRVIQVFHCMVP